MDRKMTPFIIGGKFGFPIKWHQGKTSPSFLAGDPILLSNARSGIKLVIDSLKPKNVWVPSYLCPTILTAIDPEISRTSFYPINANLQFDSNLFLENIHQGDLFIFIDFFGFPIDQILLENLKQKGCLLFRDCSQALFHDFPNDLSDFILYSPRKFLGVPDGGILQIRCEIKMEIPQLLQPDEEIFYKMFCALIMRREFDIYGGDRTWNDYFHEGESKFKPGTSSMSELTMILLKHAFNYKQIQEAKRQNYQTLLEKLKDIAIFKDLPKNVVPLGFPIKLKNRDEIQNSLFTKNIYPQIHWDISKAVPHEFFKSHQLSQQIMTLPCDQRYKQEDMNFMSNTLESILN